MCRWETFAKYNKRVGLNKCVGRQLFGSIQFNLGNNRQKKEIFDPKFAPQSNYGFKKN